MTRKREFSIGSTHWPAQKSNEIDAVFYGEIKPAVLSFAAVIDEESNCQMPTEFPDNKRRKVFEVINCDASKNVHKVVDEK